MTTKDWDEAIKLMEDAGRSMNYLTLTDGELQRAITANKLVLSYFQSRGEYFGFITSFLMREREQLKGFREARK